MELSEKDRQLIDQYLLGQLTAEDRKTFDERMTDPEFEKELAIETDLMPVFKVAGRSDIKAALQQLEAKKSNSTQKRPPAKVRSLRTYLAVAASVAVLIIAFFFWPTSTSSDQLAASFLEPYPNVVVPIVKGAPSEGQKQEAYYAYETGDFERAIQKLDALPKTDTSLFYLGISYLMIGDGANANLNLSEVLKYEGGRFEQEAQWYATLSNLQQSKLEPAKEILNTITQQEGHPYQKKAEELLQKLD